MPAVRHFVGSGGCVPGGSDVVGANAGSDSDQRAGGRRHRGDRGRRRSWPRNPPCELDDAPSAEPSTKGLVFLTRGVCVNTTVMRRNLDEALRAPGLVAGYDVVDQDTLPETDVRRGYPTPTLLYADRDIFGMSVPKPPPLTRLDACTRAEFRPQQRSRSGSAV